MIDFFFMKRETIIWQLLFYIIQMWIRISMYISQHKYIDSTRKVSAFALGTNIIIGHKLLWFFSKYISSLFTDHTSLSKK